MFKEATKASTDEEAAAEVAASSATKDTATVEAAAKNARLSAFLCLTIARPLPTMLEISSVFCLTT